MPTFIKKNAFALLAILASQVFVAATDTSLGVVVATSFALGVIGAGIDIARRP